MDWQKVINRLLKRGWNQSQLARRLGSHQGTISDILRGRTKSPSWDLGQRIVSLDQSRERAPK